MFKKNKPSRFKKALKVTNSALNVASIGYVTWRVSKFALKSVRAVS